MSSIIDDVRDPDLDGAAALEAAEKQEQIDFKMVTFSLGGRQYAVNIMKVKEISKANRFTYVPNTAAFVEGVYNLRGDIITIINLRRMFHLHVLEREKEALENIIILNIRDNVIGVIVDSIENVIGVSSRMIQPRHPLFTDIQMKYISGVIEVGSKLYVILDVERIFGDGGEEAADDAASPAAAAPAAPVEEAPASRPERKVKKPAARTAADEAAIDLQFITETLATFAHFYTDEVNGDWVTARLTEWKKLRSRKKQEIQLSGPEEAADFLDPFYSPHTGELWGDEYREEFAGVLWKGEMLSVRAWNPGTHRGSEAFSVCAALKIRYPKARVKVWACDTDLLGISAAPGMTHDRDTIPDYFIKTGYMKEGDKGWQFSPEMKDTVLFEYHDILHGTELPSLDLIVARDLLSFFPATQKKKLINEFREKLTANGILVVGTHERIDAPGFTLLYEGNIVAYQKEKE
jgi:purine-binding chemotaxis protein CheW